MRVLVTGGAGFIGSHLAERFLDSGHEVLVLDNLSTGCAENVPAGAAFENLDLREVEGVRSVVERFKPEIISHHAAQIDVRKSVADPLVDAEINVCGSVHLFSCAARCGVRALLFASSGGTVYGETPNPANETAPKAPISPYGSAKLSVESYLFTFASQGLPTLSLRYGNEYGPRQDSAGEKGVISIFSGALLARDAPVIYGDGEAVRDYVMVEDVVRANELAIEHLLAVPRRPGTLDDAAVNIGSGVSTSVNEVYRLIAEHLRSDRVPRRAAERPGELDQSRLDVTKARDLLGFVPATDLPEGIRRTVEWVRASRA